MTNLTITVPDELKKELQKHKEVNWSAVARRAMGDHLKKMALIESIASRSKLTKKDIEELDMMVKKDIAERYRRRT